MTRDRTHVVTARHATVRGTCREQVAPRPPPLRSVLVPVDGTPFAEHAIPPALALARRAGAEVTLVHVYSTLQPASGRERLGWRGGRYLVEPLRGYLEGLAGRATAMHAVRVRPLLLKGRRPADTLCEMTDWDDHIAADLVVMASRRRGWWSRFWRGSVGTEVACRSQAPVLLVPGRDEPPDLTDEPSLGRVLVPLDGSARAERALGPAAALVALTKGECDLLHVVRSRPDAVDWSLAYGGPPVSTPPAGHEWEARRYLRGVAGRLRAGSVPARWQVVADERPTAEAITRYAERSRADVIAMTGPGTGLAGLLRGSMAVRVARRVDVPVLICRPEAAGLAA